MNHTGYPCEEMEGYHISAESVLEIIDGLRASAVDVFAEQQQLNDAWLRSSN